MCPPAEGKREKAPVAAVWALCTGLRAGMEAVPLKRDFSGVGPRVGRRLSGPSKSRERTPSGAPVWDPSGAFDFRTRIKDRDGKPPPARSQRPAVRGVSRDCGISPQKNLGGRCSGKRNFRGSVVLEKPVLPASSGLFDRRCWDVWARHLDSCQGTQILRRKSKKKALRQTTNARVLTMRKFSARASSQM